MNADRVPPLLPLRILQRDFDAAVRLGVDVPGLLHEPARALAAYRHAYVARLLAALRDNHEVLARAMGDEAFDALGRAYVAAQPSRTRSIRWFGDGLAAFMRTGGAGAEAVAHPAFADLAALDWALRAAFDAADAEPVARERLAMVPADDWPALRFDAHPSLRVLALDWHVEPAWRALRSALDAGDPDPALEPPESGAHRVAVWRLGLQTRFRALDAPEAELLEAALGGATFAALGEIAAERWPAEAAARQVALALAQWIDDGFFAGLRQPGGSEVSAAC